MDESSLRAHDFRRILLIKLSAVGDVIHTVPVLNKLRRRYPLARIDWLLRPEIADLVRTHPAVSNVLLFARQKWREPLRSGWSAVRNLAGLVSQIRATQYELVIDMHGQFRTALFTLASGAPVRIGFDRPRPEVRVATDRRLPVQAYRHGWTGAREGSWIAYTHPIRIATLDVHAVDRYLGVGPMLGLDRDPPDFSLIIPPVSVASATNLLVQHGIPEEAISPGLVVLAPGTMWETKHWRSKSFAEVARHFLATGRRVVLVGSAADRRVCAEIASDAAGSIDLSGCTSLTQLAAIIRMAAICITNDSGPMHLAVALNRPIVAIFGPSDALWIGPYRQPEAVVSANLSCAPCYLRTLNRCPHDHACMRQVSAASVIERAESMLADVRRIPAASAGGH